MGEGGTTGKGAPLIRILKFRYWVMNKLSKWIVRNFNQ